MIKKSRIELGLSQTQLSRSTGVPVRIIQELEAGRAVGRERERAVLSGFLNLPGVALPSEPATAESNLRAWELAAEACATWLLPMPPSDFCEQVPCTLLQALAWCRLLKDGASTGQLSPVELGFWSHAMVDEHNLPLGIQPLPYLSWDSKNWRYLLWPQLRVRSEERTYQLDALVLAAGWCNSRWSALQLDGQQNHWDDALLENLKLPLLRVDTQEVHAPSWRPRLEAQLLPDEEVGGGPSSLLEMLCGPGSGRIAHLSHLLAS
jgi:hypothetical protein